MFTLSKLIKLPHKTMLRKLVLLLQSAEVELENGKKTHNAQLLSLLSGVKDKLDDKIAGIIDKYAAHENPADFRRLINTIRHDLLSCLGAEPSEWDFILPGTLSLDESKRSVFPISVFLEDIRSPFNVGSIFRTADSFGVSHIYLTSSAPLPTSRRAERTSRGTTSIIPWSKSDLSDLEEEEYVFGLETGGIDIDRFEFPDRGIVLVGSEELGLSPEAVRLARAKSGIVSIPLAGAKRSLNVSVAFGILMQRWYSYLSPKISLLD